MSEKWLPLHDVFGKGPVPMTSAKVIRDALDKAFRMAKVNPRPHDWQLLEWICADFLAGPDPKGDDLSAE